MADSLASLASIENTLAKLELQSKGVQVEEGRSLKDDYRAMTRKVGKKEKRGFMRSCLGADKCKNALCDHRTFRQVENGAPVAL